MADASGPDAPEPGSDTDVVERLLADHRRIERLFAQYRAVPESATVRQLADELVRHARDEERALYGLLETIDANDADLHAGERAHRDIAVLLPEAEDSAPAAQRQVVDEIEALFGRHVRDEEQVLLPRLREHLAAARAGET